MALFNLTQPMKPKCIGLEAMDPDLSNMFYKIGVDQYKVGQFSDALEKFQLALKLVPKHELAAQYLELTQSKLQVNSDRLLLEWRKSLDAREFKQTAMRYQQMKASKDAVPQQVLEQMRHRISERPLLSCRSLESVLRDRRCRYDGSHSATAAGQVAGSFTWRGSAGTDAAVYKKGWTAVTTQLALARLKTAGESSCTAGVSRFRAAWSGDHSRQGANR